MLVQGFLAFDYMARQDECFQKLTRLVQDGKVKPLETVSRPHHVHPHRPTSTQAAQYQVRLDQKPLIGCFHASHLEERLVCCGSSCWLVGVWVCRCWRASTRCLPPSPGSSQGRTSARCSSRSADDCRSHSMCLIEALLKLHDVVLTGAPS